MPRPRSIATCAVEGCDGPATSRGWCRLHYVRWQKHGDPAYQRQPSRPLWTESNWDDGFVDNRGRMRVYRPDHPASTNAGFVHRHRAVWWLRTGQDVGHGMNLHHINHNHLDDRFRNLIEMSHADHIRHHQTKAPVPCICEVCGLEFHLPQWRINMGRGRICSQACYHFRPKTDETRRRQSEGIRLAFAQGKR